MFPLNEIQNKQKGENMTRYHTQFNQQVLLLLQALTFSSGIVGTETFLEITAEPPGESHRALGLPFSPEHSLKRSFLGFIPQLTLI